MATFYYILDSNSLVHHGVKGQKWGERRYQNKDGTWTETGKARRRINNYYTKDRTLRPKDKYIYTTEHPRKLDKEYQKLIKSGKTDKHTIDKAWELDIGIDRAMDEDIEAELMMKSTKQLKKHYPSYDSAKTKSNDLWQLDESNKNYDKQVANYAALQKKIENTSWDWYNAKPISDRAKAMHKKYSNTKQYYDAMLGVALNDLGYENTKAGRDYIRNVVIWD